ncbi:hypothetical protein VTJ49DRAFT_7050 [Mycothermus thermophilus]|uniref:FAD-binding FR-type domain-containing protein n=1 Tax=Humicola insolens TaxID=85995 RepID=A0ABR3VJ80_HUMIN
MQFLPGQWVDLYPPQDTGITKPGGFTITSAPSLASHSSSNPYVELAIQHSPDNPVAAYLFRPVEQLLRTPVSVRIGGSFVFPPPLAGPAPLRRVVFVAGGMGINPMMSMLSHIAEPGMWREEDRVRFRDLEVRLLYSVKDPVVSVATDAASGGNDGGVAGGGRSRGGSDRDVVDSRGVLFLDRIAELFGTGRLKGGVQLFLTGGGGGRPLPTTEGPTPPRVFARCDAGDVPVLKRRITVRDVGEAIGSDKDSTVVYICGVPTMTDEFVQALVSPDDFGMEKNRVLFEKWW